MREREGEEGALQLIAVCLWQLLSSNKLYYLVVFPQLLKEGSETKSLSSSSLTTGELSNSWLATAVAVDSLFKR